MHQPACLQVDLSRIAGWLTNQEQPPVPTLLHLNGVSWQSTTGTSQTVFIHRTELVLGPISHCNSDCLYYPFTTHFGSASACSKKSCILIRLIRCRLLARAASGCGEACARLAWLYFEGVGLDKDFEKSFEWCSRAAEIGSPAGQFSFGCVVAAVDGELMLHAAWLYVYLTHCGVPVACTMRG